MINKHITVQIVDDHALVRVGFRHMLENHHIEVVAESSDGREALADYLKTTPDIVMMDISMKGISGLEVTRQILARNPDAKIIVVSMLAREAAIRAMEAGAMGFLSKHSAASELLAAIKKIISGGSYLDTDTAQEIALHRLNGSTDHPLAALSMREYEMFIHLAKGIPVEIIANQCHLSPKTVRSHKSHMMQKLNITNTIDFVRIAMKEGVIGDQITANETAAF